MINKVKTGKPVTLLYKVIIAVFNAVMLSGVFYTSYHLFHKLIFTKNYSDIYIHVKTVIDYNMKGYSLMTVLIKSLYSLTQSKDSIAVMLAVAVVLTVLQSTIWCMCCLSFTAKKSGFLFGGFCQYRQLLCLSVQFMLLSIMNTITVILLLQHSLGTIRHIF